jgi:putative ABC transport system substrate-binding protein
LSGLEFVADITDGFKEAMTELGYIEGENIIYDVQRTEFDIERYQSILKKFIEDDVDLILVFPTEASIEAKAATEGTDIPVVFAFALIEDMGIVDSVREPGGNVTGVRYPGPDIALKRFEIMREVVPDATKMLVPYQKGYPIVEPQMEALRPEAEKVGISLIEVPAVDADDLRSALEEYADEDIGAVFFVAEPLAVTPDAFVVICEFGQEHNIPVGGAFIVVDEYESLFGVNVDTFSSGRAAAPLADKIFKGTPAGTIPVVSAESFFQFNFKESERLGLEVPKDVLLQADEVIN